MPDTTDRFANRKVACLMDLSTLEAQEVAHVEAERIQLLCELVAECSLHAALEVCDQRVEFLLELDLVFWRLRADQLCLVLSKCLTTNSGWKAACQHQQSEK